jgi:hypothetical protein
VDEADQPQALLAAGREVVGDNRRHVAWREAVEVDLLADRHYHGAFGLVLAVVHRYNTPRRSR